MLLLLLCTLPYVPLSASVGCMSRFDKDHTANTNDDPLITHFFTETNFSVLLLCSFCYIANFIILLCLVLLPLLLLLILPPSAATGSMPGFDTAHTASTRDVLSISHRNMYHTRYNATCTAAVRPVAMEGQKFETPEDPSQTVPERSPMDPIW